MKVSTLEQGQVIEEAMAKSQRLVEQLRFLLNYQDLVTGKGLEFERLRPYVPGDEASQIDWNALARTGDLYTQIYTEERMLDVVIVVDISESMAIGTTEILKNEYAAIIATTLSKTALDAGDKVGIIARSSEAEITIEPEYSDELPIQIAKKLSQPENWGGKIDWEQMERVMLNHFNSETFVFLISDFISDEDQMIEFIRESQEKFQGVFGMMLRDPTDSYLPKGVGKAYMSDPATGKVSLVDVDKVRDDYNERAKKQEARVERKIESTDGKFFKIHTDEDFVDEFASYLDRKGEEWK